MPFPSVFISFKWQRKKDLEPRLKKDKKKKMAMEYSLCHTHLQLLKEHAQNIWKTLESSLFALPPAGCIWTTYVRHTACMPTALA
jgi:hypothetical protein